MCQHILTTDFYKQVAILRLDLFSYIVILVFLQPIESHPNGVEIIDIIPAKSNLLSDVH